MGTLTFVCTEAPRRVAKALQAVNLNPVYLLSDVVKHTYLLILCGRYVCLYTYSLRSLSILIYLVAEVVKHTYMCTL